MAKCLVADDSKIIRMLFAKIMGNLGFDVTEAVREGENVLTAKKSSNNASSTSLIW